MMSVLVKRDAQLRESGAVSSAWGRAWEWVTRPLHYGAVRRLRLAAQQGDGPLLASMLARGVALVVQSTQGETERVMVVRGSRDVVAVLQHGMTTPQGVVAEERSVNGQAGIVVSSGEHPSAMLTLDFTGRLVSLIWVRLDPHLLKHWNVV
jgi:hypothetical protein